MQWHESDTDIEAKYDELAILSTEYNMKSRQIGTFLSNLKLLKKSSKIKYNPDGSTSIEYTQPQNLSCGEMDEEYRTAQKEEIITKIDEYITSSE